MSSDIYQVSGISCLVVRAMSSPKISKPFQPRLQIYIKYRSLEVKNL